MSTQKISEYGCVSTHNPRLSRARELQTSLMVTPWSVPRASVPLLLAQRGRLGDERSR
jgi:hypothetical protein